jgi:hypothetical protein
MAIFKADPAKRLASDLAALRGKRDSLITSLQAEETLVLELQASADQICDGTKSPAFLTAQAKVRAAQDNVGTFGRVLAATNEQIKKLEDEAAQLADKALRVTTAAAIEQCAARLEAAAAAIDTAFAEFVAATEAAAEISLDGKGLAIFAGSARGEIPPAVQMVVRELHSRGAATIAGNAPAALPTRPPQLAPPPPPLPLQTCFTLAPAMFTDRAGMLRRVPRYVFVDLTEQQAAHALRMGGACSKDDARIKELRKKIADQQLPEAWHCWNFDTGAEPTNDPLLTARRSSTGSGRVVFEPLDRGPPRTMKAPPAPAVASRSLTTDGCDE